MDAAVYLDVKREELLTRLSGRYICTLTSIFTYRDASSKVAGICDIDGSVLYQRADDRRGGRERLDIFSRDHSNCSTTTTIRKKLIVVNGIRYREVQPISLHTDPSHGDTEELKIPCGKYHLPPSASH